MKNIQTNTSNAFNMNLSTIAFSKGFLWIGDTVIDSLEVEKFAKNLGSKDSGTTLDPVVLNMQIELMRFGYMFDRESLYCITQMPKKTQKTIADDVISYLTYSFGDGKFRTLYGNYPYTVLSLSEHEMLIHQIMHYIFGGNYFPADFNITNNDAEIKDSPLKVVIKDSYKMIHPISNKDFCKYFKTVLSSEQSLTSYDKEIVKYICSNWNKLTDNISDIFPEDIPFKETLCLVLANTDKYYPKTVTDVLRYAVYLSGGDISLPALPAKQRSSKFSVYMSIIKSNNVERSAFNFKKFTRAERRKILNLLNYVLIQKPENISNYGLSDGLSDAKKYLQKWIRLGEILHPGEYMKQYYASFEFFRQLRNFGNEIVTFNSRVNKAKQRHNVNEVVKIYSERPGEFCRAIDSLLRNCQNSTETEIVFTGFKNAVRNVSMKLLYELIEHFNIRNNTAFLENRCVHVKGSRSAYALPELPVLREDIRIRLMNILQTAIKERFSQKVHLEGKTYYIDSRLANVCLPKNMRTANISPGQLTRGTKIPIDCKTGIIRCYIRWIDPRGNLDYDLSVSMFGEDFKLMHHMSWSDTWRVDEGFCAIFSGDVRHRKGNCAEYIDINIEKVLKHGVRYLVCMASDYDNTGFAENDCWCGISERDKLAQRPGELTWSPDTVTLGYKLSSDSPNIVMSVVDLKEMIMYVVDEDINGISVTSAHTDKISSITRRYVTLENWFNVSKLIEMNVTARDGSAVILDSADIEKLLSELSERRTNLFEIKSKCADNIVNMYGDNISTKEYYEYQIINDIYNRTVTELDALENKYFIKYEDIISDYTKIFEWMN